MGYQIKEGDIITINGTVVGVKNYPTWTAVMFETKSGELVEIPESDVNTVCPKIKIPTEDKRRGR